MKYEDSQNIRKCLKHNQKFDIADGQCCLRCESDEIHNVNKLPAGCECNQEDWETWDDEVGQVPEVCEDFNIDKIDDKITHCLTCLTCWHKPECHK